MPPSYQIRSTAGRCPRAGYRNRTTLAVGNEKSFFTVVETLSAKVQLWLSIGSTLDGPASSRALKTVQRL